MEANKMPCCNFAVTEVTGVFSPSFSSLRYKVNLTSAKKQEKHAEVKFLFFWQTFIFLNSEKQHYEEKNLLQEYIFLQRVHVIVCMY